MFLREVKKKIGTHVQYTFPEVLTVFEIMKQEFLLYVYESGSVSK